jgi:hypothetical protein
MLRIAVKTLLALHQAADKLFIFTSPDAGAPHTASAKVSTRLMPRSLCIVDCCITTRADGKQAREIVWFTPVFVEPGGSSKLGNLSWKLTTPLDGHQRPTQRMHP